VAHRSFARRRSGWLFAAAAALAVGCSRDASRAKNLAGQTHAYRCPDGYTFVVRFEPQRAWLFPAGDDRPRSVPQVPSRPALKYTDGQIAFTTHDGESSLRIDGVDHAGCVNQPAEAARALK
jgi:membrane-bound inhibitor of C-type lysozyme